MGHNMKKKKNSILVAVLAGAAMVLVAAIVIGLSLWAENKNQKTKKTASSTAIEEKKEPPADGDVKNYEEAGVLTLGQYDGIEVDTEPTEEDVLAAMEEDLLKMKKKHKGKIQKGDYVCIDYEGSIGHDVYEGLTNENAVLKVGDGLYGEEMENSLIGKQPGDKVKCKETFADDYDGELAGETVEYEITINGRFDDYYANKFSKGKYPTVSGYVAHVKESLEEENKTPEIAGSLAWETLMENCEVSEYPYGAVEEETELMREQYEAYAEMMGSTLEETLEYFGMDEDALAEYAKDAVKDRMVAQTIAIRENITLEDNYFKEYLMEALEASEEDGSTLEELEQEYLDEYDSRPRDNALVYLVQTYIGGRAKLI